MTGAKLNGGADLTGLNLDTQHPPDHYDVDGANNLEMMLSPSSQDALNKLRQGFEEVHKNGQVRRLTFAIEKSVQTHLWYRCRRIEFETSTRITITDRFIACSDWAARAIAFDGTCAFGFAPRRPFLFLGGVWLCWSLLYAIALSGKSAYLIKLGVTNSDGKERSVSMRFLSRRSSRSTGDARLFLFRLRLGMLLSLTKMFGLPMKDIDIGGLLKLVSKHDYRFETRGWIRSVSGLQSILGLYLVALGISCLPANFPISNLIG